MLSLVGITVAFSIGLVAAAWFAAPRDARRKPLIWMMGLCGFASFGLMLSAVLFLHFAIMGALLIVWWIFGRRPAMLRTFAILAPIWPYTWGALEITNDREKLARLRAEYPVTSVAERLAYEKPPADRPEAVADFAGTALAPAVLMNLVSQEERQMQRSYRNYIFESLHDETRDRFVGSQGFGNMRMAGLNRMETGRTPAKSIDQPEPDARSRDDATPDAGVTPPADSDVARSAAPSRPKLEALHASGAEQFVGPERRGYAKNREHVVGFEPHRFEKLPALDAGGSVEWRLVKLELVSLLKHAEPRVYVSTHLPRMDELKDAPTRPLDGFEGANLPLLRTASDTVVVEELNSVRMLGAVRADKTCLECHNVARGELLGAFSYVFRRATPLPEPLPTRPAGEL